VVGDQVGNWVGVTLGVGELVVRNALTSIWILLTEYLSLHRLSVKRESR
jgi:hypothetical protein